MLALLVATANPQRDRRVEQHDEEGRIKTLPKAAQTRNLWPPERESAHSVGAPVDSTADDIDRKGQAEGQPRGVKVSSVKLTEETFGSPTRDLVGAAARRADAGKANLPNRTSGDDLSPLVAQGPRTRELVGAAVGWSGKTYGGGRITPGHLAEGVRRRLCACSWAPTRHEGRVGLVGPLVDPERAAA